MAFKPLNWRECESLARVLNRVLAGGWIDRVLVPARPRVPGGFLKSEWALRVERGAKGGASHLILSIRPRYPYAIHSEGRGPQAAASGTRSGFDLQLGKWLQGVRIVAVRAADRERQICFELQSRSDPHLRLELLLWLVPATPALLLRRCDTGEVLAQSGKEVRASTGQAPAEPPVRDLANRVADWTAYVESEIDDEARALHVQLLRREAQALRKLSSERLRQSTEALEHSESEPDWQHFGRLLQGQLYDLPPITQTAHGTARRIIDPTTGESFEVPADPKLDARQQMEKFFHLAKRKVRRAEEARARLEAAREALAQATRWLERLDASPTWEQISRLREEMGLTAEPDVGARAKSARTTGWVGKCYRSREGLAIWVGRSRAENLELTFRNARGNDLWMHLRGKPGAHVIIPLNPGKSASLETLLDAAALTLQYSGGAKWGKTEVDYTFRKYVKRIKDSQEVSYTNNKTLIVAPDSERLKRLLGGGGPPSSPARS